MTAPLLPWGAYVAAFPSLAEALRIQSDGGMSAWAAPILLPVAVLALVAMGRQRAAWWIVPVLWPSTQWYYTSMVMPAATLLAAMIVAVPYPWATTAGAVVVALTVWSEAKPAPAGTGPVLDGTTT